MQAVMDYYGGKESYASNPVLGEVKVGKSRVKSSTQHRPIYGATIERFKALRGTISKGKIINAEKIYRGEKRYDIHCRAY